MDRRATEPVGAQHADHNGDHTPVGVAPGSRRARHVRAARGRPDRGGTDVIGTLLPRLVFECLLARLGFVLLRQSARRVDELRERRSALVRAEAALLARHRQEREYLALLHDTAASTFLLVTVQAKETDPEQVAEYARHDLAVLTGAAGERPPRTAPWT